MKFKRIAITAVLAFAFLTVSFIGPDVSGIFKNGKSSTVAFAAGPKGSSGGFKSGSFKGFSSGSSGGFKSGSFFGSSGKSKSYSGGSSWFGGSGSSRSFIPIPIPFHIGGHGIFSGFGLFSLLAGGLWSLIKLIIVIAVIYAIVKSFRRRR